MYPFWNFTQFYWLFFLACSASILSGVSPEDDVDDNEDYDVSGNNSAEYHLNKNKSPKFTANQRPRKTNDSGAVLQIMVGDTVDGSTSVISFDLETFMKFHDCFCNRTSSNCNVNQAVPNTSQSLIASYVSSNLYSPAFSCNGHGAYIHCWRLTEAEYATFQNSPPENFMSFRGGMCGSSSIEVIWNISQRFSAQCLRSSIARFLSYSKESSNCINYDEDKHEDSSSGQPYVDKYGTVNRRNIEATSTPLLNTRENKENSDAASIKVITILIPCIVLVVIIVAVFLICLLNSRSNKKIRKLSTGATDSLTIVPNGLDSNLQHDLNDRKLEQGRHKAENRFVSSSHQNQKKIARHEKPIRHARNNTYTTQGNSDDRGINNTPGTTAEHMYASIDDVLGIQREYASLDDANKYSHSYKALHIMDPKLRPPMPLPSHATQYPVYYSVALPTVESSSNENNDDIRDQYLELVGDNEYSNAPIQNN